MRIALVLYGKRRDYEKCRTTWNQFKQAYDPDIFYHGWGSDHVEGTLNGTKTKGIMISQDIDFSHLHQGINQYSSSAVNVLPQMYSILQSDRIRVDYENIMGFKYDWIVRSRFDLSLHFPTTIRFDVLDAKQHYVCANHWPGLNDMYDDNIMMSSSDNMRFISHRMFDYTLIQILNHKVIPSGEQILGSYIKSNSIVVNKIESLNFTLGRNL